jgi:hypothetical protein
MVERLPVQGSRTVRVIATSQGRITMPYPLVNDFALDHTVRRSRRVLMKRGHTGSMLCRRSATAPAFAPRGDKPPVDGDHCRCSSCATGARTERSSSSDLVPWRSSRFCPRPLGCGRRRFDGPGLGGCGLRSAACGCADAGIGRGRGSSRFAGHARPNTRGDTANRLSRPGGREQRRCGETAASSTSGRSRRSNPAHDQCSSGLGRAAGSATWARAHSPDGCGGGSSHGCCSSSHSKHL